MIYQNAELHKVGELVEDKEHGGFRFTKMFS